MHLFAVSLLLAVALALSAGPGCTPSPRSEDLITVEGAVSVRGNEPFSAYVLETHEGNTYVLVFDAARRDELRTPDRIRVVGAVYRDEWQGRPYAHLRVRTWERLTEAGEPGT